MTEELLTVLSESEYLIVISLSETIEPWKRSCIIL